MTESAERILSREAGETGETGTRLAAAGGMAGALAASSCCILPLVLFSLGASGPWIGKLSALAPYEPFFIGFSLISLGYGFRRVYWKPAACVNGTACAGAREGRLVKGVLWLAAAMVALALAWPYAVSAVLG